MRETCIACGKHLVEGDEYFMDVSGGFIHAACIGPEGPFVDLDTGEPITAVPPEPQVWADE